MTPAVWVELVEPFVVLGGVLVVCGASSFARHAARPHGGTVTTTDVVMTGFSGWPLLLALVILAQALVPFALAVLRGLRFELHRARQRRRIARTVHRAQLRHEREQRRLRVVRQRVQGQLSLPGGR